MRLSLRFFSGRPGTSKAPIARICISWCILSLSACGVLKPKPETEQQPAASAVMSRAIDEPLSPEETEGLLGEVGTNWFYGQGLGETALTAGTIFLFPPYAIYVAGNAILNVSGYEEIRVTDALPEEGKESWNAVYEGVTSVPGRVTAGVSGEEFRDKEKAKAALQPYLARNRKLETEPQVSQRGYLSSVHN